MGTTRAKLSVYMESLKLQDNYVSLKTRYLEQQARSFPTLGKKKGSQNANEEAETMDSNDTVDDSEDVQEDILPVSPV